METYLGETAQFWLELKRQVDLTDTRRMISEIATLRAKVSFYESRIAEMDEFRINLDH